ncbi:hypothetical protein [Nesterenkonia marinintestina]|uniref:hypothetical protein n=1 Tax=Nesterenkonia marinintestina TaxID=2979865 RepID=UPI0021BF7B20|nr:hypothetical protein [Nesterenkonia sp. GX14115]
MKNSTMIITQTTAALALMALLGACSTDDGGAEAAEGNTAEDSAEETGKQSADEPSDDSVEPSERETSEAGGPTPRLAVTYDGGVQVLEGATLEELADFPADGFLRLNPAGDGRHLFLTEGEGFRLLDAGTWGEPHGDHSHSYTTDPLLTDITVDGDTPGHVVSHEGTGTLFFDGSGEIRTYDLDSLDAETEIDAEEASVPDAHHGVAVTLADGSRLETIGDGDDRSGARVVDADGEEIAASEDCPGVHGETAMDDGTLALGCEDGALLYSDGEFTKVAAEDSVETSDGYARTGNLFPAEGSTVLLGDRNLDPDGEEPMTEIALLDAETQEFTGVDVGAAYNFRSLARGPEGEALVLAEDGVLHAYDESGEDAWELEIMDPWTEPEEWQEPRPAITVDGDLAYITDPESQEVHLVDLTERKIINSAELDVVPNEIAIADGRVPKGADEDHEGHDHEEHNHEDHDH